MKDIIIRVIKKEKNTRPDFSRILFDLFFRIRIFRFSIKHLSIKEKKDWTQIYIYIYTPERPRFPSDRHNYEFTWLTAWSNYSFDLAESIVEKVSRITESPDRWSFNQADILGNGMEGEFGGNWREAKLIKTGYIYIYIYSGVEVSSFS